MSRKTNDATIISIHAPRGGSDYTKSAWYAELKNFNPRSPWGERLNTDELTVGECVISIHAPRGGSDHVRRVL